MAENDIINLIIQAGQSGDYFSILNLKQPEAFELLNKAYYQIDTIKKSYKQLSILTHPDKNKHPLALDAFELLNKAYNVLKNEATQKNYIQTYLENIEKRKIKQVDELNIDNMNDKIKHQLKEYEYYEKIIEEQCLPNIKKCLEIKET